MRGLAPAFAVAVVALAGCPSDENAAVLWLALDGRETAVRFVEEEPTPY